jgi:hypothetical protein
MKKIALAALSLLLLSACQISNPLPKDFYSDSPEHRFPEVSVFSTKPSDELAKLCSEAACIQGPQLANAIYGEFRKSNMFERLSSKDDSDYNVHIAAFRINPGDVQEAAKVIASAATLMVVPMQFKHEYRSEFLVTWRDIPLAQYSFAIPYDETIFLLKDFEQALPFGAESIAARFIATAQGDGVFSTDFLYSKLQAENYPRDLRVPTRVGNYTHDATHVYPDPFLGAQLHFRHNNRSDDKTDAFVYPIRRVEWSKLDETLVDEMEAIKKDAELVVKAGVYKAVEFAPNRPFAFTHEGKSYSGQSAAGTITLPDGSRSSSKIYLFVLKDKFVKFRITQPDAGTDITEIEGFVTGLIPQLVVPDESLFIATLRQQKRNSTIQ